MRKTFLRRVWKDTPCSLKVLFLGAILVNSPHWASSCIRSYAKSNSQEIASQSQLEELAKTEIKKLGLETKQIRVVLSDKERNLAFGTILGLTERKHNERNYKITLYKNGHNTATLKHELYHIYKGHLNEECSKVNLFLNCFFNHKEFPCDIYAATGLKF